MGVKWPKIDKIYVTREQKDTLNRKPLGVMCSNCQDFLFLMMSISGASFQKSVDMGFEILNIWMIQY